MDIWEELGIAPTGDERAIKRAYAQRCRVCHPEDDPEGFVRLHEAFQQALRGARGERTAAQAAAVAPPEQSADRKPDGTDIDFEALIERGLGEKRARQERLRALCEERMGRLERLVRSPQRGEPGVWRELLQTEKLGRAAQEPVLRTRLESFLLDYRNALPATVLMEFYSACGLTDLEGQDKGDLQRLFDLLYPRVRSFREERARRERRAAMRKWIIAGTCAGLAAAAFLSWRGGILWAMVLPAAAVGFLVLGVNLWPWFRELGMWRKLGIGLLLPALCFPCVIRYFMFADSRYGQRPWGEIQEKGFELAISGMVALFVLLLLPLTLTGIQALLLIRTRFERNRQRHGRGRRDGRW